MKRRAAALFLGLLVPLAGCGGGGSSSGLGAVQPDAPAQPSQPKPEPTPPAPPEPPPPPSPTQVLVDVKHSADIADLCRDSGATSKGLIVGTDYYLLLLPDGMTVDQFLVYLDDDMRVVDASEDVGVRFPEGGGSTIPLFGHDEMGEVEMQLAVVRTGARGAHDRATGAGVIVAVVDTGIYPTHPLVAGRIAPGGWDFIDDDADATESRNFQDDDGDGHVDEGFGHGTFVASLVLAMAPDARILPIRALNSDAVGTASSVASAIAYAVDHGADIVNLSAGLSEDMKVIRQAVDYARQAGVVVVAAAGNHGDNVEFPAELTDVEAVTATDDDDKKAPFAAYGPPVDLCAPGVDLIGAHPLSPSGTARWSGTSFSAALVSGACALVRERFPSLSRDQLLRRLEDTAVSVDALNPQWSGDLGAGRIDVDAATD